MGRSFILRTCESKPRRADTDSPEASPCIDFSASRTAQKSAWAPRLASAAAGAGTSSCASTVISALTEGSERQHSALLGKLPCTWSTSEGAAWTRSVRSALQLGSFGTEPSVMRAVAESSSAKPRRSSAWFQHAHVRFSTWSTVVSSWPI
jgi:hypothetical protein